MSKELYPKVYLYRRIVYAKLFIDDHFAENIDLQGIANEAFFSKFHFIRIFKGVYKKTPYQYLSSVRVEKARMLLVENFTVAQVCYAVGFESISSFTGLFKSIVGQTPAAYQTMQQQKLLNMAQTPLKYIPNCFIEGNSRISGNSQF